MYDLIYGGMDFIDELKELFPTAKIEDASDEIHDRRLSIEMEIETVEYQRIIILNGFYDLSIGVQLADKKELAKHLEKWKAEYPEYFIIKNPSARPEGKRRME